MPAAFRRSVIIGNSGSGKSWLGQRLAGHYELPCIDLDTHHWLEGEKREAAEAGRLTAEAAAADAWVIEGVYGWLAELALPRATALLWLDLPWSECRVGLLQRQPQDNADLLQWAEAYWTRQTSSSFAGHARLYESFAGCKQRLTSRAAAIEFLSTLYAASSA